MSNESSPLLLAKLVKQHAQTARLMGVDFVPTYRMQVEEDAGLGDGGGEQGAVEVSQRGAEALKSGITQEDGAVVAGAAKTRSVKAGAAEAAREEGSLREKASAKKGDGEFVFVAPKKESGESERAYRERALDALRERYLADAPHDQFVTAFTNLVWGDGDPCAEVCFVGEAPGEEEDKTGKPFVGRSGNLLNQMIVAMGYSRESVYICNVLKTRPPNNATPTTKEIDLCRPYLLAQLSIVKPKAIVTLGLPATKACLQTDETMTRLRGNWASMKLAAGESVPVMPTYHPAYLLRSYTAENRGKVWSDLCMVLEKLGKKAPKSQGGGKSAGVNAEGA
jgi:uracil-DNA glycosylase family 4